MFVLDLVPVGRRENIAGSLSRDVDRGETGDRRRRLETKN